MKKIVLIILLLSFKTYSQDLIGNWKVISYEDEIVYYNKSADSVSYKDPSRKEEAENFRKTSAFLIFPISYNFDNKGNILINHETMGKITSGKYEVDKTSKKILIIDDKDKKDELPFIFSNGMLFIEMKMEDSFIKLGLKKI